MDFRFKDFVTLCCLWVNVMGTGLICRDVDDFEADHKCVCVCVGGGGGGWSSLKKVSLADDSTVSNTVYVVHNSKPRRHVFS